MSIVSFESKLASEESLETFLQTLIAYPWRYTLEDIRVRLVRELNRTGKGFVIPTAAVARIAPDPIDLVIFLNSVGTRGRQYISPKLIRFAEEYILTYENLFSAARACILYSTSYNKRFGEEVILRALENPISSTDNIRLWVGLYCKSKELKLTENGFEEKSLRKKKAYGLDQSGVVKDQNDIGSGQQNILDTMKQDADVHPQEVLLKQREKDEQPSRKYRSVI